MRIAPLAFDVVVRHDASSADAVRIDERLRETFLLREHLGDGTREEVGAAARGRLHDELDGPGWVRLRLRGACNQGDCAERADERRTSGGVSTSSVHDV